MQLPSAAEATTAGSDFRASTPQSLPRSANAGDGQYKGMTQQEANAKKPNPTPFLTERELSIKQTSYPGVFQFLTLGFWQQNCSTWEILLLEKLGDQLRNTKSVRLKKWLVYEEKK